MSRQIIRKLTRSRDVGEQMDSISAQLVAAAAGRAYATASPAPQKKEEPKAPLTFPITERINIVEVPAGTTPDFRPKFDTDTMVLDGHAFGVTAAVEWARAANEYARKRQLREPLITVIADADKLEEYEYRQVTKRLANWGGLFFEYPEGVSTFAEAFRAYAEGVAATYQQRVAGSRRRRA